MVQSGTESAQQAENIDGRVDLAFAFIARSKDSPGNCKVTTKFRSGTIKINEKKFNNSLSHVYIQINDDTGVQLTFDDVRVKATRVAQNLRKRGYESRTLFCFVAANTDDLVAIYLAAIGLACTTVPLHSLLTKDEMVPILKKIQAPVIFCDDSSYDQLNEALIEAQLSPYIFVIGEPIAGVESAQNLFIETGDECNFM